MKFVIAGGRDYDNYGLLSGVLKSFNITEVVCGEAKGADALGKQYAIENNIPVKSFPADWKTYGPAAGPIRNKQMAEYTDEAIVFWDGKSKGTKNMIAEMNKLKKECSVVKYQGIIIEEPTINDEEW